MASKETVIKNEAEPQSEVVTKSESAPPVPASSDDKELDDLLDDAIGDFDKPAAPAAAAADITAAEGAVGPSENNKWLDEFVEHVSTQFDGEIKGYLEQMGDGKDLSDLLAPEEFRKIMENTSQLLEGEAGATSPTDMRETISETLRSISEGIDNLQSNVPDELPSIFNGLNLNSDEAPMMPLMQNLMEMFLSKEVLHPSMDALCKSFPAWLEQNKETLPTEDYDKYKKQYELMTVIVKKLEEENPSDPPDVKKERIKRLIDLMQELQKFGHPPKELIAESGGPYEMGGPPQLPMDLDPSKCAVM